MGITKTHKLSKYFLYSLWVLPKPIKYTNIFVVFMGFDLLYRFVVTHICIAEGFLSFVSLTGFSHLYLL